MDDEVDESKLLEQMFNALLGTAEAISQGKEPLPPGPIGLVIVGAACEYALNGS